MEQVRAARRSASHGSINRRYAANMGYSPELVDSNPFARRPLRSVNENVCLLPSPGPLESMLKTTTETGDIGLFSIRPSRSTTNLHQPFHAQSSGDKIWQRPPTGNVTGIPARRDNGSTPRSRDMASEIVSMYGSASQRSASSTFSQPLDDLTQRTYSMTSCSSRPISNKKSNGTLQSQSSGIFLQRPRSPFPYPARLRRPGVRPSSPAWTDNGGIDYSRMIRIDRLPHRTIRNLRRPTYPHSDRRPAPNLPRLDSNGSVSRSSPNSLAAVEMSSGQISTTPTTRDSTYHGRPDSGKSDNSLTSTGPTSIHSMYRPTCPRPVQDYHSRTQSEGVIFYDYSEHFDQVPPVVKPSLAPLAPIPTRAPSLHRHMVLDERYTIRLREANTRNFDRALRVSSPMELDSGQESPRSQHNHLPPRPRVGAYLGLSSDVSLIPPVNRCSDDTEKDREVNNDLWVNQEKCDRESFKSVNLERYDVACDGCLQPSALPRTIISQSGSTQRSASRSCETQETASYHVSGYPRRNKSNSVESDISSLGSPVQSPKHADTRASSDNVSVHRRGQGARTSQESATRRSTPTHHGEISIPSPSGSKGCGDHGGGECDELDDLHTYRRPYGISSSNNKTSSGSAEGNYPPETEYALPIFAPQPVSPARRLKLQNSVPQLMKALPLSPSPRGSTSSASELLTGELDLAMNISSRSHGDLASAFQQHHQNSNISKPSNERLRLKIQRPGVPRTNRVPSSLGQVKTSRSSTLRYQGLSEMTQEGENRQGPESTTTSSRHNLGDGADVVVSPSGPRSTTSVLRHASTEMDELFIDEPSSPRRTIYSASLASTGDLRSTFSDGPAGSHKPPRGLRKRVSDLRTRLIESRLKSTACRGNPVKRDVGDGVITALPSAHMSATREADESDEKIQPMDNLGHTVVAPRGLKGRMSKWMTTIRESVVAACTGSRKRG